MVKQVPALLTRIKSNSKVLTVFIVSIACILLILKRFAIDAQVIFQVAFSIGLLHQSSLYIIAYFLRKYTDLRKWHTYIRPNRRYSAGKLLFHLIQFLILILILPFDNWNVVTTTLLLTSFMAGMALAQFILSIIMPETLQSIKPVERRSQLDEERYEAFIASIVSSVVLGSSFIHINKQVNEIQLNGLLLLPILYAIINAFVTYGFLCIHQNYYQFTKKFTLLFSSLSLISHFLIIDALTYHTLPETFLLKGLEYTREQISLIMQAGLVAGFVAGIFVLVYHQLARWHVERLLNQNKYSWANFCWRVLLNIFIYLTPIACILFVLAYSSQVIGLYGIALSFLCMLSNIGLKLFIQHDRLDFTLEKYRFSPNQIKVLQQSSPSFKLMFLQVKAKVRGKVNHHE